MHRPAVLPASLLPALLLAACSNGAEEAGPVQRFELAEAGLATPAPSPPATLALPQQSATGAQPDLGDWQVDEGGQAIVYRTAIAPTGLAPPLPPPPLLTLACELGDGPPQLRVIRHTSAQPGKGALFPVIGNGMRSRFVVDATLVDGEWRWEGSVLAEDPRLDVFTGPRELIATLPGGGRLDLPKSRIPGEFINWCRAGGQIAVPVAAPIPAE